MQDADNIVDFLFVHGQQCVLGAADLLEDVVNIVFDIEADNIVLWHQDIVYGNLFQIQYIQQHALRSPRYTTTGLIDNGT